MNTSHAGLPLAAASLETALPRNEPRAEVIQGYDALPGLAGFADFTWWTRYDVLGQLDRLTVPTLMIDAGNEEMFSIADHGRRAYEQLMEKPGQEVRDEMTPGIDHYGIYFGGYDRGSALALDWSKRQL